MRYVINTRVVDVEEKTRVVSAVVVDRYLPSQRIESERESLGWFVTIAEGLSFRLSNKCPELEPGDKIKITIEKIVVIPNGSEK